MKTLVNTVTPLSDPDFESRLAAIVEDVEIENSWLEMLSLLEYVGLRKIVRGVSWADVDFNVLIHLSEEAQHAASLRALVPRRDWSQNPWIAAGWNYFQGLDRGISKGVDPAECYAAVSWAIERRVLYVYPLYSALTKRKTVRETVDRILAQEQRHAEQAERAGLSDAVRTRAIAIEAELWNDLVRSLSAPNALKGARHLLVHEVPLG